ncbi:hypothetical protein F9L07_21215 [Pimelobacter simplex]|uniref:Uncharacterized protein n=1 Tax=Nocardioides simplex TaxID=2045 RepID=A0A7J5DW26_NOCSI|nr:hypothetical protein [Pimelobacter simplex]KAB2809534.1 hypothetical protein F9L07_21215 [Pimelobacter simplex]
MPADRPADARYLERLDAAIRSKRIKIRFSLLFTPLLAVLFSGLAFLSTHRDLGRSWGPAPLAEAARAWYSWSQGWASPAEAGTTALGLLTAALTLYVATSLTTLDHDRTSADGAASRLLLDDVTLVVCLSGSVACWILSAGAGWTAHAALGWAPAGAAAVVLSLLAACAESRQLYADRERWALVRAEAALAERLGLAAGAPADVPRPWVRTFPWRWGVLLAAGAAVPAVVRIGVRYPHDPDGVVLAGLLVVAVWLAVLCAAWSWWSSLGVAQVRYARVLPSDSGATGALLAGLVATVVLATLDVGDEWAVLSLALLALATAAPAVTGLADALRRRDLIRHLAAVRRELAGQPEPARTTEPAPDPAERVLSWSVDVGPLRVRRFAGPSDR